jgi:hypothetical protein
VRATEKTKVYAFYKVANVDFKKNDVNDSKGNLMGAGIEGDLTARLTGIVEANSVSRKYSQTITGEPNEYTTGGFSATLKWKAPSDWTVGVSGGRGFQESVFNRYYMTNTGSVSITKPVGKRFEAQVQGSYGVDQYPGKRSAFLLDRTLPPLVARRKDTNISAGLKLIYVLLPRQTVSARYLVRQRTSNFDTYNYTDSTVTLSADYTF